MSKLASETGRQSNISSISAFGQKSFVGCVLLAAVEFIQNENEIGIGHKLCVCLLRQVFLCSLLANALARYATMQLVHFNLV